MSKFKEAWESVRWPREQHIVTATYTEHAPNLMYLLVPPSNLLLIILGMKHSNKRISFEPENFADFDAVFGQADDIVVVDHHVLASSPVPVSTWLLMDTSNETLYP